MTLFVYEVIVLILSVIMLGVSIYYMFKIEKNKK
ncbi:MAG: hypothetical protein RLZZ425_832 [Bacteroidota bacterium]|jgi:hypothetical protein